MLEVILGDTLKNIFKLLDCYQLGCHKILFLNITEWIDQKAAYIANKSKSRDCFIKFCLWLYVCTFVHTRFTAQDVLYYVGCIKKKNWKTLF